MHDLDKSSAETIGRLARESATSVDSLHIPLGSRHIPLAPENLRSGEMKAVAKQLTDTEAAIRQIDDLGAPVTRRGARRRRGPDFAPARERLEAEASELAHRLAALHEAAWRNEYAAAEQACVAAHRAADHAIAAHHAALDAKAEADEEYRARDEEANAADAAVEELNGMKDTVSAAADGDISEQFEAELAAARQARKEARANARLAKRAADAATAKAKENPGPAVEAAAAACKRWAAANVAIATLDAIAEGEDWRGAVQPTLARSMREAAASAAVYRRAMRLDDPDHVDFSTDPSAQFDRFKDVMPREP